MAVLPLYHIKSHVRSPKWAKFPEDFYVIEHAIIDDHLVDHPLIAGYRWSFSKPCAKSKVGRARRFEGKSPRRSIRLSRVVWEIENGPIPDGMTVDHKNLNSLDDRIENLRLASHAEQNRNQSKKNRADGSTFYKGVIYHPYGSSKAKHYHGVISPTHYPMCCLGYYLTPEEAASAYNFAAVLCYGEFARLNDIPPGSVPPDRQQEIRSIVEQKLQSRGLIPTS